MDVFKFSPSLRLTLAPSPDARLVTEPLGEADLFRPVDDPEILLRLTRPLGLERPAMTAYGVYLKRLTMLNNIIQRIKTQSPNSPLPAGLEDVELLLPLEGVAGGTCALPPLAATGANLAGVAGMVAGSEILTEIVSIVNFMNGYPLFRKPCLKYTMFTTRIYIGHRK